MNTTRDKVAKLLGAIAIVGVAGALFVWFRRPPAPAITAPVQDMPRHDLVQIDGRWYRNGQIGPFTGWMVGVYPGGEMLSRSQISNGLLNGVSETWYTNGQMQVREHFKDGISDGLREKWHENGALLSRATIAAGKVIGTFQSWHENGQLCEQIEMKLGQADGTACAYYPSGCLKAETTVRDGEVLDRKLWKDGERKAVQ